MNPEFYMGTSGWSYNHWKKIFYADRLPRKEWLSFYSRSFNSVEVNMTFYRFPLESAVANWAARTPDDFVFTFKAPQLITHHKHLVNVETSLRRFYDLIDILGDRGRSVLFQMPPSFHVSDENIRKLESFLYLFDERYDHTIEFRDKSWWCEECYSLLGNRCGFCSVSGLDMPRDIVVAGDILYLRFHGGHYNLRYSEHELEEYARSILAIAEERKVKRVYIYFNNDYNGYAVVNALEMKRMITYR